MNQAIAFVHEQMTPSNNFPKFKAGDNINVQIPGKNNEYFATSIIDATGKTIYKRSLLANKIHSIETSGIAAAVYFIVLRDSEGKIVFREMLLIL